MYTLSVVSGKVPQRPSILRTFFSKPTKNKRHPPQVFLVFFLENFSGSIQDLVLEAETFRNFCVEGGGCWWSVPWMLFFSEEMEGLITRIFLTKRKQAVGGFAGISKSSSLIDHHWMRDHPRGTVIVVCFLRISQISNFLIELAMFFYVFLLRQRSTDSLGSFWDG